MMRAPERPPSVPDSANFNPDYDAWECSELGASGQREGVCRFFRRDGSLYMVSTFEKGLQNGAFSLFHPDGTLARQGTYVAGELDGEVVGHASDAPTPLRLRACCVPDGARKLRSEYRHGQLVREIFYDAEERALGLDGLPIPPRPDGVPENADYDDVGRRWLAREVQNPLCHLDRSYDLEGRLAEELSYRGGYKAEQRRFDASGAVLEHVSFDEQGRPHGPYLRRFGVEASPYADERVTAVRGRFEGGQAVACWELLGAGDTPLRRTDLGLALDIGALASSPALAQAPPSRATFDDLSRTLAAAGRVREALCAKARAAVRTRNGKAELESWLAELVFPLRDEFRDARGQALNQDAQATPTEVLEQLLAGCEAATAFRVLGSVVPDVPWAAHELVEASLLLAPERTLTCLSRGLLRVELGDTRGAALDATRIEAESPAGAELLRASLRVYFPDYTFWPAQLKLPPPPEGAPDVGIAQPLEAVERVLRVYATRIERVSRALLALLPEGVERAFDVPALGALLLAGPAALRREKVQLLDPEGNDEPADVEVNEEPVIEAESATRLSTRIRADYAALAWLCWAVGLERIALPERIVPRSDFAAAVSMALLRAFRVKDRLTTGGLMSLAQGVPGFSWEGLEVDTMAPGFANTLLEECRQVRAMFLWLMWPENESPFQSDLCED